MASVSVIISVAITTLATCALSQSYIRPMIGYTELSWTDSNTFCELSYGTALASIHNDTQNNEAKSLCPTSAPSTGCWIGGNDGYVYSYEWLDGTPFDYGSDLSGGAGPWDGGNPDRSGGEHCLEIFQDGWNDGRCEDAKPFLCNHPSSGSYIPHTDTPLSWNDSNTFCKSSYGTTLASIHNDTQNDEANSLCPTGAPTYSCWIGGNDGYVAWYDAGLSYEWLDGTAFDYGSDLSGGVGPWSGGNPDINDGREHCLEIYQDGDGWNDAPKCENDKPFLCNHPFPRSYISHTDITLSWNDSNAFCEFSYGTTLASIHSDAQNDEAGLLCPTSGPTDACWIGGNDHNSYSEWLDGTPFDYGHDTSGGVYPWLSGNPDGGTEHCLELRQDNRWNDNECDNLRPPICNYPTSNPTEMTQNPTNMPTSNPTKIPTTNPTDTPTPRPTKNPTTNPTKMPTTNPTQTPTTNPTTTPTHHPTTVAPSRAPTPRPTNPGDAACGDRITGAYNDENVTFIVHLPFVGNLQFDASSSDFSVTDIEAFTKLDMPLGSNADGYETVSLYNLPVGKYKFKIWSTVDTTGTFDVEIICESANPTPSPTLATQTPSAPPTPLDYTPNPTNNPTKSTYPTKSPTIDPTKTPTNNPSNQPSILPTNTPIIAPSKTPINVPSETPTNNPSNLPSIAPLIEPSNDPSISPSKYPSSPPTEYPTEEPTVPTFEPSFYPSLEPTHPSPTTDVQVTSTDSQDESDDDDGELSDLVDGFIAWDLKTLILVIGCLVLCIVVVIGLCVFLKYQKKKMGIQKSQEISIKITSKPKMMSSNFQPTAIARVISAPPKVIARNQKVIRVKSKPKERKVVERHGRQNKHVELEELKHQAGEIRNMRHIVRMESSSAEEGLKITEEGLKITEEGSQENVAKYHKKHTIGSDANEPIMYGNEYDVDYIPEFEVMKQNEPMFVEQRSTGTDHDFQEQTTGSGVNEQIVYGNEYDVDYIQEDVEVQEQTTGGGVKEQIVYNDEYDVDYIQGYYD
eukprot:709775_1